MHYPPQSLLTILFLLSLFPNLPSVCALNLPFGHYQSQEPRQHDAKNTVDVELPDMGFVKTRQSPRPIITVPQADLRPFLLALRETEVSMIAIIDAMLGDQGSANVTAMPSETSLFQSIPISTSTAGLALPAIQTPTPTPTPIATPEPEPEPVPDSIPASELTTISTITTRSTTTITITTPVALTKTRSASVDAVSTIASSEDAIHTVPVAAPSTTTIFLTTRDTVPVATLSTITSSQGVLDTVPVAAPSTTISFPGNMNTIAQLPSSTSSLTVVPSLQVPDPEKRYTFDATSSKNIAVYFGQSDATQSSSLEAQCADPNIDIVILAFIVSQPDGSKYPSINFGPACGGQTDAMRASAPGLLSCPQLAGMITSCQNTYGKKVLLSMGGSTGGFSFAGDGQAAAFADTLWGLFGPVGGMDVMLRPFGGVEVDGFDFDNENNNPTGLAAVAHTLRAHFSSSSTIKSYYLSSAPQCPFPDQSNPVDLLLQCDFVWVQFYNNPSCELGSPGFEASVRQWSDALSKGGSKAKLYLGAPAWAQAGPTAGSEGMLNLEGGKDIIAYAKEGLSS
ncbi:Endochitinase [Lachnellula hyalina]|uniref:chitinase n=1 Tax=Lachnellula hyalina TaxID=1316788 RepID=A0A8H8TUH7_9HELO|nr:Endochitinase [Lachnellula hyalina]TVY22302.1 Endochitinase [Lachnellula hyalina]